MLIPQGWETKLACLFRWSLLTLRCFKERLVVVFLPRHCWQLGHGASRGIGGGAPCSSAEIVIGEAAERSADVRPRCKRCAGGKDALCESKQVFKSPLP
jgi:hypothetical protein